MEKKILGILGGMGPEATQVFYKKIIDCTQVDNDREHLDIFIYNHASIPDRTECILCGREEELWNIIEEDILKRTQKSRDHGDRRNGAGGSVPENAGAIRD